jgi:hypothetical protein
MTTHSTKTGGALVVAVTLLMLQIAVVGYQAKIVTGLMNGVHAVFVPSLSQR